MVNFWNIVGVIVIMVNHSSQNKIQWWRNSFAISIFLATNGSSCFVKPSSTSFYLATSHGIALSVCSGVIFISLLFEIIFY